MRKWLCINRMCGNRCTFEVPAGYAAKPGCLLQGAKDILFKPAWIPEGFLPEEVFRAQGELPRVKEGDWVFIDDEARGSHYLKVTGVRGGLVLLSNEDIYATYEEQRFLREAKPARLRPYNASELEALVGINVLVDSRCLITVTGYCREQGTVLLDGLWKDGAYLLEHCLLNGRPCGVFEHPENGEWRR